MLVLDTDAATGALGHHETHAILLASARRCVADTERDLVMAHLRRDTVAAMRLVGELTIFIGLLATLSGAPAPMAARAAA